MLGEPSLVLYKLIKHVISGEVYYVDHVQSRTQWTHPRTGKSKAVSDKLPFGWERQILEDNKGKYL